MDNFMKWNQIKFKVCHYDKVIGTKNTLLNRINYKIGSPATCFMFVFEEETELRGKSQGGNL